MDVCAKPPFSGADREHGMSIPSSNIVYLTSLDRLGEVYYGLRVRVTEGGNHILSSCWRLTRYLRIRQRKALTPAFSNAAIRKLTSVFYDSAYKVRVCNVRNAIYLILKFKVKSAWDNDVESSEDGNAVIEVQNWCVALGIQTPHSSSR